MSRLAGKRMVITGSSRGLGREFALAAGREGASIVLNGTDAEVLASTAAELEAAGIPVRTVCGSVADSAVSSELMACCVDEFGGIDVLVNNAGIVRDRTLLKMTDEDFDEVLAVDLRGPFLCTREAARAMREQGNGHIIQVTSASGLVGNFGQANYAAAKAGLMGLMYTSVIELARYGIRSNALWPVADTDMTRPLIERTERSAAELGFGNPADVALALVWLASDASADWNGQCLASNGRRLGLWRSPAEDTLVSSEQPLDMAAVERCLAEVAPRPIFGQS